MTLKLSDFSYISLMLYASALIIGYFIGFNAGLLVLMFAFGFWVGEHRHQIKNKILMKLKESDKI